jgi:hypothetical protein
MGKIRQSLLVLKILFFAILIGMIIPAAFGIYLFYTSGLSSNDTLKDIFQFAIPLLAISCVLASKLIFKKRLFEMDKDQPLLAKLDVYKSAFIFRCAILEAPAFLSIVALFLTGDVINLIVLGVILVIYGMQYPSSDKVLDALPLNDEEVRLIREEQS